MSLRSLLLALACSLAFGSVALAKPPLMPEEMVDACDGLSAGAACTFEMGGRVVLGNCAALPDKSFACRPNGKKPVKKGAAPKAAPKPAPQPAPQAK